MMGRFIFKRKSAKKSGKEPPKGGGKSPSNQTDDSKNDPVKQNEPQAAPKKFAFLKDKAKADQTTHPDKSKPIQFENMNSGLISEGPEEWSVDQKKPSILPGSHTEHLLQEKRQTRERAINFYDKQVIDFLAPKMQEFIKRQEFLFIASADRNGECDCTSKFGKPGFIRVLSDKYLIYPEYRGNGVFANAGNMMENPHIAMLMIDFTRTTIGLHVNGKVKIVSNEELFEYQDKLPKDVLEEINQEGKKQPEHWIMVEVEEAYIQCSKHIPLMKKMDKKIDWGTDNMVAKGGDYFQLLNIPLYKRVGGDKAMEVCADVFYRKVLKDELVAPFFEDVDMEKQRLKQKSFLAMAFGGPYQYSGRDLREAHKPLLEKFGLTDQHFDRVCELFKETTIELNIAPDQIEEMMTILESTRDDILNR